MAEEPRDQWGEPLYNALQGRLITNPQPRPMANGPFMMGGRWYRQVDNGRQDVLVNRTDMGGYEADVAHRVRNGEVVDYFVRPLYDAPGAAPSTILMSAQGSRGDFTPALIPNPIGGLR